MIVTTLARRWTVIVRIEFGDYVITIEVPRRAARL